MKSDNVINSIDNRNKLPQKRKTKLSKIPRDKIRASLSQTQIATYTRYAIEDIVTVKARLHRIKLSAEQFVFGTSFDYFKKIFPNLSINQDFVPAERMPNYKKHLIVNTDTCVLNIFIQRIHPFFPAFHIELTPKEELTLIDHKNYLSSLNELIPNLQVSSVEYTLDIFLKSSRAVENLYIFAKRSIYVPYKNDATFYDDHSVKVGKNVRFNFTFNCGDDVKMYERGPDNKKTIDGWNYDETDRLRFEHTANRDKLKNHKILSLTDLIENCKFTELNENIYKFKKFKSKKLPQIWDWDSYSTKNYEGHSGAFQLEYSDRRLDHKNIRQRMTDVEEFEPLKALLSQEMIAFDSAWKASNII